MKEIKNCLICGKVFQTYDKAKYCSRGCYFKSRIGHQVSLETRQKISMKNKGNHNSRGVKHSEETIRKTSIALKKWASSPEGINHFKKMRMLSHSPEAEKKRSESLSEWNKKEYERNPQRGQKLTEKAHEKTRQLIKLGMHPFQKPENLIKAQKTIGHKNYGGTWIEKKIGWLLDELEFSKESQKPVFKDLDILGRPHYIFADFHLPDYNLIIECDGSYWHQDKVKEQKRDAVFQRYGYNVLHLQEKMIRCDLGKCKQLILQSTKAS